MSTLVKNQHYVWRYYLSAWARGAQVWCVRAPAREAFPAKLKRIGSETFFYRFRELQPVDLAYLDALISKATSAGLRDVNRGWIEHFQRSFAYRRRLAEIDLTPADRADVERALKDAEKMMGEQHHTRLEIRATPILDQLRQGDGGFYEDLQKAIIFIDFLSHQYFRTARMRNIITRLPKLLPHSPERTWPIESFIYATNVASSLVAQRRDYRLTFLQNDTPIPFVAGDQPVINLNTELDPDLCLFYPLSPQLALVYHAGAAGYDVARLQMTPIQVELLNAKLYAKSDSQMYSNDRAYLEGLVQLPKDAALAS